MFGRLRPFSKPGNCVYLGICDEPAKMIYEEIASVITGTEFKDRSMKTYDRMDLEELEQID